MIKIYSHVDKDVLLHIVYHVQDGPQECGHVDRQNLCAEHEPLQVAVMHMEQGATFRPHYHHKSPRSIERVQESWVIIRGSVCAVLYDLDGTILAEPILYAGDCSITLCGGHSYRALEPNTMVYEFKNGPYLGQKADKSYLD
jgi:cupin fold WbuC family metalloprotein